MNNYCYDTCPHNLIPRRSFQEVVNHKVVLHTQAEGEKNKKLQCTLGYKQTVASRKALLNSEANGTRVCPSLRKVFPLSEEKKRT